MNNRKNCLPLRFTRGSVIMLGFLKMLHFALWHPNSSWRAPQRSHHQSSAQPTGNHRHHVDVVVPLGRNGKVHGAEVGYIIFLIKHTRGTLTYACRNSFIGPLCAAGGKQFLGRWMGFPPSRKLPQPRFQNIVHLLLLVLYIDSVAPESA